MKTGKIPDILKVYYRPQKVVKTVVDGKDYEWTVEPIFPVASDSSTKAAEEWSLRSLPNRKSRKPICKEESNFPMTNLKFLFIDERGEGGRAYKVMDVNGRMFDMREDVVVESIHAGEFNIGIFSGQYVWGMSGSQMRLCREGSKLYQELKELGERKKRRKLKNSELEVGHVYATASGQKSVVAAYKKGMGYAIFRIDWYSVGSIQDDYEASIESLRELGPFCDLFTYSQSFVEDLGRVDLKGFDDEILNNLEWR